MIDIDRQGVNVPTPRPLPQVHAKHRHPPAQLRERQRTSRRQQPLINLKPAKKTVVFRWIYIVGWPVVPCFYLSVSALRAEPLGVTQRCIRRAIGSARACLE